MRLLRWRWLPVALLVLSVGLLSRQFLALRHQADSGLDVVVLLTRSAALMSDIEGLEMQLMYEPAVQPQARKLELDSKRAEFKRNLGHLDEYRWAAVDDAGLLTRYREYDQLLGAEVALIEDGDRQKAILMDKQVVDPAFDRLSAKMTEVQQVAAVAAAQHMERANLRLSALALIGIGAIGGFFYLEGHLRQRVLLAQRETLSESERRFRLLTERSSDVVLIVDATTGRVKYASPSIAAVLAMTPERACRGSLLDLVYPDDRSNVAERLTAARAGENQRIEFRGVIRDEEWIHLEGVVRDLSAEAEIGGLVVNLRDIDDQKRAQTQLMHTALHDTLTGLPNRLMFTERLQTALERVAGTGDGAVAVLFIDIDDFKVINDSVGHQIGDLLIMQVAQRLGNSLRRGDTIGRLHSSTGIVARMGGDEFTVMLDDVHDAEDTVRVCERIHTAMMEPFLLSGGQFYASVSIGVALSTPDCAPDELMRNADVAMYRAKWQGKARYAIFDEEMHERVAARLRLETDLRIALEKGEFVLHYQPIVCLKTGRIRRVEALLRWRRNGQMVPPGDFITVAEESGLIRPIGDWALREACTQAALWNKSSAEAVIVCVNISGKQFTHPKFLDEVMTAIADTGVHPECLEFEITEGVAMEDAERTRHTLGQLQAIGVHLALDDFGTGYSSLSYLRRFAVNTLKIDKSFVVDLPNNRENLAIVQTIIELARVLGLATIAEGIETPEQLATLQSCGCTLAQGYWLQRPQPAHAPPWPNGLRMLGGSSGLESSALELPELELARSATIGHA
jgi:diguanylate cyclase (GGDEF)-like protein/PAS domain S-box-containing protein